MSKRYLLFLLAAFSLGLCTAQPAQAQDPTPEQAVFSELVGAGYDVIAVGYLPDEQGNPNRKAAYAQLETISSDLNTEYVAYQSISTFISLARYYPSVEYLVAVLRYDHYLYFFVTNPQDLDDLQQKRIKAADFWRAVRRNVRIYDTATRQYISEKDFVNQSQVEKNQTQKDFSGQAKSPLPPTNTNPNAKAENILVEPTTTYLPADGTTAAYILATLTDKSFAGLPGRSVTFNYEVRGQDERNLGNVTTDKFGTARAKISSSRALDVVLLRAGTATLNAAVQVLVSNPVGDNEDAQVRAVVAGLKSQGYKDVEADVGNFTGPTGDTIKQAFAVVRVTSKSFDRAVYSQLSRMLGTMRTVIPEATILRPLLQYKARDGHDYTLIYSLRADIWDSFVRGDIGENQLWQSIGYDAAVDEDGRRVGDKDFINKNFGATPTDNTSSAPRSVQATLTAEEWGDQFTVGSFLVPVGGWADSFVVNELADNATGFAIFQTPNYNDPVIEFKTGDDTRLLGELRLTQGQYIVEVRADTPPARVTLDYVEHLSR